MSKQTAVEWLIEEMHKNIVFIPVPMQEKAKEMAVNAYNKFLANYQSKVVTQKVKNSLQQIISQYQHN